MAGSSAATLIIRILTDATKAQKGLDQTRGKVGKLRGGLSKATGPALAVVGAVAGIAAVAGKAASELQQADGAVESVFGDNARLVQAWGRSAAQSVGLATDEYENLASVVGSQLKSAGTSTSQLAGKTDDLIGMGADLAATFGGPTSDAVEAIGSLLRGERDPIERYGVSIKQADINAYKAAHGLAKLKGSAAKQADAQATLALLTQQTADAQGQFARESDTAAGAQQRATAEMENASATLGQALLPYMAMFAETLAEVAKWAGRNAKVLVPIVAVIGALAVAILVANAALAVMATITALIAAPWLLIGLAVAAVVIAVIVAYRKVDWFRAAVDRVWQAIKQAVGAVIGAFVTFRDAVVGVFETIRSTVATVIDWIVRNWRVLFVALTGPIGVAVLLIMKNWDLIMAGVRLLGRAIAAVGRAVSAVLVGAFRLLASVAKPYIDAIRTALNLARAAVVRVANAVKGPLKAAWGVVREAVNLLKTAIGNVANAVKGPLVAAFDAAKRLIQPTFDAIKATFDGIAGAIQTVIDLLGKIKPPKWLDRLNPFTKGGKSTPTLAYTTPSLTLLRGGRAAPVPAAAGSGTTVNVYGAIDPQGTARAVQRLLHGADVRTGRRRLA